MWETSLLKFDGINVCNCIPKDPIFIYIIQNSLFFYLKDTCYQVGAVIWSLTWEKFLDDFGPLRIAGDSQEDVNMSKVARYCHRVLVLLLHVPWTSNV